MINRISFGTLSLLAIFVLFVITGIGEEGRMSGNETNFASRSVEAGATLYADACSGCHGIQGQGIPGVAPALNSTAFFNTRLEEVGWNGSLRGYIESTVEAGRPVGSGQYSAVMPTWGQAYGGPFRPDQVYDVASYVLNWEATAAEVAAAPAVTPTPLAADASPVEIGQALYVEKGCQGCHGEPYGEDLVGPNLGGIAVLAAERKSDLSAEEYIHESIVMPNAYIVEGYVAGIMPQNYGDQLSDEELDAMVQYLLTLD